MIGLTPIQQQCLDFLRTYHAEKGVTPTLQEITDRFGWVSKSNAARMIDRLEERGHIRRSPRKARSIEFITPDQMQAVLLNREIYALVRAYAASQHIGLDTATNELLRGALGAA
jgi:SOS-response transcriptional repressor LexA